MIPLKSSLVPLFFVCFLLMELSLLDVVDNKRTRQEDDLKKEEQPKRIRQIQHIDGNWPSFAYILSTLYKVTK